MKIHVEQIGNGDPYVFRVRIREKDSETQHRVTMSKAKHENLTGGTVSPEQCIEAAFAFLLDREPKEAILSSFDISLISTYFPDFGREIGNYLK